MNRHRSTRITISALLLLAWAAGTAGQDQDDRLTITVTKGRLSIAIAVPEFLAPGGNQDDAVTAKAITETVREDLRFAIVFNLADPVVYDEIPRHDETEIPISRYAHFGVQTLALGKILRRDRDLEVEIRLFDIGNGKMIFGTRITGSTEQQRYIAHNIAGSILYYLTGDRGIFDRKIISTSTRDVSRPRDHTEIWIMDYDGFNQMRVTYSESLKLFPYFGPGESGIVYTTFINENADVYHLSLEGGEARKIVATTSIDMTPEISPDGRRVVYASSAGGNMDVYVCDSDGGNARRLTNSPFVDSSPCWSPDGRRIAFTSGRTGSPQIYVMDADGSNQRRLTFEGNYNDGADWSPDGTMIAYASRRPDNRFDICIYDLTTSEVYYVTRDAANDEEPAWSSDGRYLAFSSDRNGSYQIYVVSIDGRVMRQLTRVGVNKHPSWSK